MKRLHLIPLFVLALAALSVRAAEKPNIIFIVADGLGYGEAGYSGQKSILTPNLDRMAKEGMRASHSLRRGQVARPRALCV